MQVLALGDDGLGLLVATPFDGFDETDWPGFAIQGNEIDLSTTDNKITAGGWVVLSQGTDQRAYAIAATESVFLQEFTLSATVTELTVTSDEGAETAIAVLLQPVDATAADQIGLIAARGPAIVSKAALVFDASVDQPAEKAAKHAQLAATGIVPRETA